jgi:histone deacetylase 1/2
LTNQLQAIGLIGSQADHSLYIYHQGSTLIYLLIYVDDIILAGADMQSINRAITLLQNKFAVKDIGDLTFFLGIKAI